MCDARQGRRTSKWVGGQTYFDGSVDHACPECGRKLTGEKSIEAGMHPKCAEKAALWERIDQEAAMAAAE